MKRFFRAVLALLLTTACAQAVPVTLRVVDENNQPIAGATVEYLDYADWQNAAPSRPVKSARVVANATLAIDLQGAGTRYDADGFGTRIAPEPALGAARVRAPAYGTRGALLIVGENRVKLGAATQLSGLVQDETGAALVGARVELVKIEKGTNKYDDIRTRAGFAPDIVTTGADGRWKFGDLARGYAALLVSAPGKVTAELDVKLDAATVTAPPLRLQNAGIVQGRILDANGRPLSGVSVGFTGQMDSGVKSSDEGRFVLPGVPLGENTLGFWSNNDEWLGLDDEAKVVVAAAGQAVDVGEVRAGNGVLVSGHLRMEDGKPLANFAFLIGLKKFRTDATGHFEGRVEKYSYFANFAIGYAMVTRSPYLDPKLKTVDVGEIVVGRATSLPLDVRDENGRAMPQAELLFVGKSINGSTYFDGQLVSSTPLLPGDYELKGQFLWEVIEPKTVKVALLKAGEKTEPLRIVVRPLKPTRVGGRVVDERGQGIANAPIPVIIGGFGTYLNAVSGDDGRWQIEFSAQGEPFPIRTVQAEGYKFLRGGEWTHAENQNDAEFDDWQAADIVMARTDVPLLGRVTDAEGAPVKQARVSWEGATDFNFPATDAQGDFEIKNLPAVPAQIRASDGPRYAETMGTPGTPVQLKLPAAQTLGDEEVEMLWDQLDIKRVSDLSDYFDALGATRVFYRARQIDKGVNPREIGEGLSGYLSQRIRSARTPDEREAVAREGFVLLRSHDVGGFNIGMGKIAVLAAQTDNVELREWAAKWLEAQKKQVLPAEREWYHVATTAWVMQVSAALGHGDARMYRDIWLSQVARPDSARAEPEAPGWGATLWQADPRWFDEIVGDWPATRQVRALNGALSVEQNGARAKALLTRLEKLANNPAVLAADAVDPNKDFPPSADVLARGRTNFARSMALVDAPAALDALDKVRDAIDSGDVYAIAAAISRPAIANGQNEIARRALKLGLRDGYNGGSGAPALALIVRPFDAELAAQLMEVARKNAKDYSMFEPTGWRDVAAYAFALRDFDAATGRLLLEDQWAKRQQTVASDNEDFLHRKRIVEQQALARTMAIYDLPRALQWLDEINDDRAKSSNQTAATRLAIIATALTPAERRAALLIGEF